MNSYSERDKKGERTKNISLEKVQCAFDINFLSFQSILNCVNWCFDVHNSK